MLHAPDYSQMDLKQLESKMLERKKKDKKIQNSMRLIIYIRKFTLFSKLTKKCFSIHLYN